MNGSVELPRIRDGAEIYIDKNRCCGCAACVYACPHNAVEMKEDSYGFKYPSVDRNLCVSCNRCRSVCQFISSVERNKTIKVALPSVEMGIFYQTQVRVVFSHHWQRVFFKRAGWSVDAKSEKMIESLLSDMLL